MTAPSGDRPPLRIGNAEREATYAALNAHLDAGRLDAEEYGERYGQASVARTRPELEVLFLDLPAPHPVFAPSAAPASATADHSRPSWARTPTRPRRNRMPYAALRLLAVLPIVVLTVAITTGAWFLFFVVPAAFAFFGRHGGCAPSWGRRYGSRSAGRSGSWAR